MQVSHPSATLPPWLSSSWLNALPAYNELLRRQLHSRYRDQAQPAPAPGLTLYAYSPYSPHPQPIFRFGGFPGVNAGRQGTTNGGTVTGANWNQYPFHQFDPIFSHSGDLSRIPGVLVRGARPPVNVEWEVASGAPVGPNAGHGSSSSGTGGFPLSPRATLRAWLFGTALVVLVVVLVRAIDKCLDLNLLKSRRRSQEWPTPTVRATNRHATDNSVVMMPDDEFPSTDRPADYSEVISVDLPPPYSECLRDEQIPDPGGPKLEYEEPPPDYNDTYVEFSNKNGVPSVLIYSRRRTPLVNRRDISGTSATDNDTSEQNAQINAEEAHTSNAANRDESASNTHDSRLTNCNVQVISYMVRDNDTANTANNVSNDRENSETAMQETNEQSIVMV